ncbi:hypothetical protein phiOC_p267 [Ochrobactrum phage vB_OspM_OC]|nr:hypothetical protein phiOC_p267 [Ochrobactrum phage vB_OspM_OC]
MKTIEEHNNEVLRQNSSPNSTNIACPNCQNELQYKNRHIMLLSYPAQSQVICFECGFETTVYVN